MRFSDGSVVCDLKLSESLQSLGDAVCHALALVLADYTGIEVFEARLHALGCSVDFELGAHALNGEETQFVFIGKLVSRGDVLLVVVVLLLQEISHYRHYYFGNCKY